MNSRLFAVVAAAIIVGATSFAAAPVRAQSNPNADQIINALKPTGTLKPSTRGIRPAATPAGQPSAPAAPIAPHAATTAPPPAQTATAAAEAPSINLSVQFAFGSADLTPGAIKTLDELGRALTSQALSGYRFRIEGHTDTVGSPDYNKALSQERAARVAEYLESKFGVPSSRLEAIGRGSEALLVPTPPQTPEPRNRRVQIINLGA